MSDNKSQKDKTVTLKMDDFATLCICAIRYCHGRQTYMPDLVRSIVKPYISLFDNNDITVMLDDCDFQRRFNLYGDDRIDKPGWIDWEQFLAEELNRRNMIENGNKS